MKYSLRTLLAACCFLVGPFLRADSLQILAGHVPTAEARAAVVGPLAPGKELTISISLPWRNREALTNFLQQVSEPASPAYRQYLTPAEFAAQFGPTGQDYQSVLDFAQSNGLTVTATNPTRSLVTVRATVAAINKAFNITLTEYEHPTQQRRFFAPDREPSLNLATPILHIGGLDNFTLPKPMLKLKPLTGGAKPAASDGSAPGGLYMGADFRHAYAPDVALDGAGQNIALIEFDGYYPQDIASYEKMAGLPAVPLTNVLIGSSGAVLSENGNAEVSLDIEMAASMATNLQSIRIYETQDDAEGMLDRIASDDIAKQISCSWSFTDVAIDQTLQEFAAQGQSFFSAAGDSDAYPVGGFSPSDSPYATSVGGTSLTMITGGASYVSEVVWNEGAGEGTGGGISSTYLIPDFQTNLDFSANQGSSSHRNVPDVAMTADNVFIAYENGSSSGVVGTSCATPLWAAFNALANELAVSNGMAVDGYIDPALYSIAQSQAYASTFHDITSGNNESPTSPTRYSAVVGYDLCTGWGSPTGSNLVYALGLPEPLRLSPVSVPPFAGPVGGPFGPSSITFSLGNSSASSLKWGLVNPSPDFNVSSASGTITVGGQALVTVTLNPVTASLPVGIYSTILRFTNLNDHFVQSRDISLLVAAPPVILSQPTNQSVLAAQTAQFQVGVATNSQLAFQWWKSAGAGSNAVANSSRISGATSATLTIANVTNSDVGSYFVVVSNAAGALASSNAVLTIRPSPPIIASAPTNILALPGNNASFSVTVIGTEPLFYQWRFHGTNLFNTGGTTGATSPSLTVSNISAGWAGAFTVLVTNALGSNSASATLSVVPVTASGSSLVLLSSFSGGAGAQNPVAGLLGSGTVFYGTDLYGGLAGFGGIYRMATTGAIFPLASFTGAPSPSYPVGGLIADGANFYGTSATGGNSDDGTVFRVNTAGQTAVLHSFSGGDGDEPETSLTLGKDGALYGVTLAGGAFSMGNLFRITTAGAFSNLVSFDGVNGNVPLGNLIQDVNSNFLGTTEEGGLDALGNVFIMTPNGKVRTLISFDGSDGAYPVAGLTPDAFGNYYGSTHDGGLYDEGEIFVIFPDGSGEILYSFGGVPNDGANPYATLTLGSDGNLYGSTEDGGAFGFGTVFVVSPDGNLKTLASFDGFQGNDPAGQLLEYQSSWYGVTFAGGANDLGAAFKLTVSGPLQITGQPADQIVDIGGTGLFQVATYGSEPVTYQWRKNGTNLVDGAGVTGSHARVLTIADASTASVGAYSVIVSNSYGSVTSAPGLLQLLISTPEITEQPLDQSVLVGQTALLSVTAVGDYPLTYQWMFNGQPLTNNSRIGGATNSTLTIRQAATTDSGVYSVVVYDDLFYAQSSNALLSVTPLVANGFAFQSLHSFGGGEGSEPYASLVQAADGKLYGTAVTGGKNDLGSIYDVTTSGVFSLVYSFGGANDGDEPFAGLVKGVGSDTSLYGVAAGAGLNGDGAIFRLTTSHVLTPLYSFTGGPDGESPEGTLVFGPDANLYGTTAVGGNSDAGAIFSATTKGAVTPLYSFNGLTDGDEPLSGLTLGADGNFYGTAYLGGTNDFGSVYEIDTNGNFTLLHAFDGFDGADPVSSLVQGPDGRFYGTAFTGGPDGFGTVFAVSTNGDFTNIFSFDNDNSGAFPNAGLVASGNGGFFGAVQQGGPGGAGGVYEITTNGAWTPILWFTGANGAAPLNAPAYASDGYFYGTTFFGGVSNLGSVYRFKAPAMPQITSEPADVFATLGAGASFSVTAVSPTPLSYQWYFDGAPIALATNSTYTLLSVSNANIGSYDVTISNLGGSTNSRLAILSLISDALGNGGFETGDFTDWTLSGNSANFTVLSNAAVVQSGSFGASLAASNSLGYLTTTAATTNGVSYWLSLWLDSPDGRAPNEFAVLWDGNVIFDSTNLPALGWTNLQFLVAATNSVSSISLGARDDASTFGVDNVTLTPVPALETTTITQTPGQPPQVNFNWSATPGLEYQIQYKNALSDPSWIDYGPPIISSGGPLDVSDFLTNSQRFYRVVLLP